ncbi:hypothetical protein [Saccharomonospora iraqiensis]|uniref:hypothetical protein n=1 Tax=Saccharomonospora iraqiensis TaxID=52698 RepID=UPI0012FC120C|nr:hypothetical protein [Saccharomonospora iraqiensis]
MGDDEFALVHNANCGADAWTSKSNMDDHFDKHGSEMGFETPAEYAYAAEDLMCMCDGRRPGVMVNRDGDTRYFFDKETGEFGIASDKGIVTYYKADAGIDHFNEQRGVIVP